MISSNQQDRQKSLANFSKSVIADDKIMDSSDDEDQ